MSVLESFPRITPFLWFDNTTMLRKRSTSTLTVFKKLAPPRRITKHQLRWRPMVPESKRCPLVIEFELDGQKFSALNGGQATF